MSTKSDVEIEEIKQIPDQAPQDQAPQDQAPQDQAPQDQAPQDQAPQDQAPQDQAPQDQAHKTQLFIWCGYVILSLILVSVILHIKGTASPPLLSKGTPLIFSEDFDDKQVLSQYTQAQPDQGHKAGEWVIKEGRLFAQKIHNAALWITPLQLPQDVRVEFDAWAQSKEGDVKCEIFGDGQHHQSGYILIAGGWKNRMYVIARQDEHGEDRREDRRCHELKDRRCVTPDQKTHWIIERRRGVISWFMNDVLILRYHDQDPIKGRGFAFNNWSAPVSFDHLRVYDLTDHL